MSLRIAGYCLRPSGGCKPFTSADTSCVRESQCPIAGSTVEPPASYLCLKAAYTCLTTQSNLLLCDQQSLTELLNFFKTCDSNIVSLAGATAARQFINLHFYMMCVYVAFVLNI
jgi:hypothetical protein